MERMHHALDDLRAAGSLMTMSILSEIYNWFTEGFDTADLIDAKTLLQELEQ
jgi:hypothetical protein